MNHRIHVFRHRKRILENSLIELIIFNKLMLSPILAQGFFYFNENPTPDEVNELSVEMKKTVPKEIGLQTCFFNHTTAFSFFQDYMFPSCSRIARIFRTVEFLEMVPCRTSAFL